MLVRYHKGLKPLERHIAILCNDYIPDIHLDVSRIGRLLPADAVVVTVVAAATPHAAIIPIEIDGIQWARSPIAEFQFVPHFSQLLASPIRGRVMQEHFANAHFMITKRASHLKAIHISGFNRLLDIHVVLNHIEKKLK